MASFRTKLKWWFHTHFGIRVSRKEGFSVRVFFLFGFLYFGRNTLPIRVIGLDHLRESELFVGYLPWNVKVGGLINGKTLWLRTTRVCP